MGAFFAIPLALACIAGKVETGPGTYTMDIMLDGYVSEHTDLTPEMVNSIESIFDSCS